MEYKVISGAHLTDLEKATSGKLNIETVSNMLANGYKTKTKEESVSFIQGLFNNDFYLVAR
jgi:hypothetical protein